MKNELTLVHTGDVLVMKSGEILYVTDIDPINQFKQDDKDRNVSCRIGHIYKKGEQTKKSGLYVGIIEDRRHDQVIAIDMSKGKSLPLSQLDSLLAANLGTLDKDKMKSFSKLLNDYFETTQTSSRSYW